jgi:hypothetical protein
MADTNIFRRLQRLFSTDVIIRNNGGDQVKVMDTNSIQQSGEFATNSLVDRYNRIYSPGTTSLFGAQFNLTYRYLRTQIYSDYDIMDTDAIVASALDIVAEESTLKNDMGCVRCYTTTVNTKRQQQDENLEPMRTLLKYRKKDGKTLFGALFSCENTDKKYLKEGEIIF